MTIEYVLVIAYLVGCIRIGLLASRKVLVSRDEYWVAGRRIGTMMNAMAIMAALASGGSIIGVMGYAYSKGIPYTLALFAGAVLGFPLASILVAKPLRNFGKFTITDFLAFRFPHPLVRYLVPIIIVVSFTVYIIAQMKAAGITVEFLLGIEYKWAVTISTVIFILYVSIGGMLAITWTDVMQGALMLFVVIGTALIMMVRMGSPFAIMETAAVQAPELGQVAHQPLASYLGSFVIWAAAADYTILFSRYRPADRSAIRSGDGRLVVEKGQSGRWDCRYGRRCCRLSFFSVFALDAAAFSHFDCTAGERDGDDDRRQTWPTD